MPTRNVVLTTRQAEMIEQLLESGRYQNASEVLREGLRLLEQRDAEDKAKLKALRDATRVGLADVEAQRYRAFDGDDALRRHLATLAERAIARRAR